MASTFSTNLAIELIGTGDQAGTWGTTTNSNLGTLIEQAISGYVTQAVATGTDTTITIPNGSTGVARNMYIELTGTGGTNTNLIVPANKKLYFIFNNSTGAVTVKVSGQTGVSVPTGKKMVLVSNGTDIVNGLNYIADFGTNSFSVTNLTASSATITNLIATSGSITTLSATSGSITNLVSSDASATVLRAGSATLTHLSATSASITNLTLTSLVISNLSIASANITTLTGSTQTLSGNLTLNGGTANGVLYLNGSKVATSGSALTFDGTNLSGTGSIGTTIASKTAQFNAAGGSIYASFADGTKTWRFGAGIISAGAISLYNATDAVTAFTVDATGNFGIGTSSPSTYTLAPNLVVASSGSGGMTIRSGSSNYGGVFFADGTTGDEQYRGYIQYNHTFAGVSDYMFFGTAGATKMTLDNSGNLGLGVTPSAWASSYNAFQFGITGRSGALFTNGVNDLWQVSNAFFNGSDFIYYANGTATAYNQANGTHNWRTAASGTAGNAFSFTQAMTLDASGNLGIGTTSPQAKLVASNGGANGYELDPVNGFISAYNRSTSAWTKITTRASSYTFNLSNTNDAVNIDASGNLLVGTTSANTFSGYSTFQLGQSTSGSIINFQGGATSTSSAAQIRLDCSGTTVSSLTIETRNQAGTASTPIVFKTQETERARITAAGGLAVGTTTDPGAGNIGLAASKGISFISGGFIASSQGQITVSGGTTTTFVTLANANENRTYLVSVRQSGSQNNYVVGFATSYGANASIKRMVQDNAGGVTDMDFAISGLNLQLVLGAGFGSTTWDYIVTRLS
jgi:hypothetical protein